MPEARKVAAWRIILAFVLDLITAFFVFGYIIGWLTGGLTKEGFSLQGGPALALFALIIAYYYVGGKYLGGTIWQRILGAVRD